MRGLPTPLRDRRSSQVKNHNTVAASTNLSLTFFTFPKCLQKAVASPHNSEQVQDLSPPQMKNFRAPQGFQRSGSARSRLRRRACTVARPRGGLNFGGGEGREVKLFGFAGKEPRCPPRLRR
ncbi:hypothetical protein E5288_WYG008856 [Bos mutus]|uniref:Uncharacterized protein n=1 Tax=Bos mutus TaxID=72004 RepID=A0A6B0QSA2_9CETA|nr:hypothetical protein [Bos mutus]